MPEPALAERLVDLLGEIRSKELPGSTRAAVIRNSLQVLGVARLGLHNPVARDAVAYVARYERGEGATAVATGVRTVTPTAAAFANAIASHADFREDTHGESASHPGVVVMPAALAAMELSGPVPAGRYVEAVVAGHELIGRLGGAAAIPTTQRGFRPPSVYTVFGGALAAAIVLGCTPEQQVHALALAAQGASGLNHPFAAGTDEWFLAPALAARHGLMAALLARSGLEGSPAILEGVDGVFPAFAGRAIAVDLTPPGIRPYEIERTRLKAALTCGWNQSLVNQLKELAPDVDAVVAVEVRMSPLAGDYPGVARTTGFVSRSEALLSAPFATALQLCRGSLDHHGYAVLDDPELLEVAGRVSVTVDANLIGYATTVDVTLSSGEVLRSEDDNDNPRFSLTTSEQVIETLRRNYTSAGLDPALVDALVAGVEDLVDADDTTGIAEALGR